MVRRRDDEVVGDRVIGAETAIIEPAHRSTRVRWRRPSAFAAAVAIVSGWGAVANLARLGFPGYAVDEPVYAIAAWRYVHGDTGPVPTGQFSNFDNFEHPPLAKYLFGLAELVAGHPSVVADRVVAALCTLATAVVLGVWLGHVAGRWVGLGAAAMVAVLPMSVPVTNVTFRFSRYGFLDPVAELFAVGSVALAWVWFRRVGRAGWVFAIATGVCVGLATASKENGLLGAVGPVVVGLALTARRYQRRVAIERLLQALVAVIVSGLVFAATYIGVGGPRDAVPFMLRFEREHPTLGHPVEFAGRITNHPPGWAFLWFAQHGLGAVVSVLCLVCVGAAILLRRDRLVLWCVAALIGPLTFHIAIARVVLSFYWVMWMPAFLALVAIGVGELVGLITSPQTVRRAGGAALAALCVVVLTVSSLHGTYRMLSRPIPQQTSYPAAVLAHSPQVYLRLGDTSGTRAADSSGNNRAGSYAGAPRLGAASLVEGDRNKAVVFNGSDQFARIAGAPWMNAADFTFTVWFSGSAPGRYLVARDDYVAKVWNLNFDATGHVRFVTYSSFGGHGQTVDTKGRYDDGRPHMAVCVKFRTSMLLFIDGSLAGSASWRTFATSAAVDIDLAQRGNHSSNFHGTLDEFAFYDVPLSATDVRTLYRAGAEAS
jgi:hypothetical protein